MATKLQMRYGYDANQGSDYSVQSAKGDISWCETTASTLDRIFVELIEHKVLTTDSAYSKQLRSIINKVRTERATLSEELFDHLEGKDATSFTHSNVWVDPKVEPFVAQEV